MGARRRYRAVPPGAAERDDAGAADGRGALEAAGAVCGSAGEGEAGRTAGGGARREPGRAPALVGDGPERGRLEALFAGRPAVFTGYLRGIELAEAFASADVFVFPSATDTFGQVVLQAMASGVPPVVGTGSATAELVPAGVCGLHVAPGRPGALAAAVRRLIEDEAMRRSMGLAASEYARRFSWQALVLRLVELLAPGDAPGPVDVPRSFAK
ncbi:glycosyltransferase [Tepidiforma flava]|uniref:Glycosyltransferase n=1 Tax=Tepidiforma flava TaxID=3004094 RepID=A0ABY7M8U3_9CHLR|nr:glycosyltransferase [Tepidiforma flava]WBL36520.1 glycosyltransferase [Tepidiforma flava]